MHSLLLKGYSMKRALAVGGLAGVLMVSSLACTPRQIAYWMQRKAEVEATETVQDDQEFVEFYNDLPDAPDTPCKEWFWYAIDAGWTWDEWVSWVSIIMFRESRCVPTARNPGSGATGLMQEMEFWAPICHISIEQLKDPYENLKCARVTYLAQGKRAWSTWKGE